jgi:hypothetical protein
MSQDRTSKIRRACAERGRKDGWTPERQLRFLDALARTRSVTRAAAAAGMSRESAYRLRSRSEGGLLALLWDRALEPQGDAPEVHNGELTDGRIARLLATHFRRERGHFYGIEVLAPNSEAR